jgi:DNA polymerase III sliding clamp (beta) subunit (PCNA family)
MKPIVLPIAELKAALAGLGKVITPKATLPLLKHVKIDRTADGWIALTGTDLDHFITVRFEHPSEGPPATVLVPYDQLLHTVKSCGKGEQIRITTDPENLAIQFSLGGQTGETKIKLLPVTEFPVTPRLNHESVPLPAHLRQSFHEAMSCTSTDATRYVLNGTFIDVRNPKANYLVGTDGKHLYSANSFTLPLKQSVLIPSHKFLGWKDFLWDGEWQIKSNEEWVQLSSRRWRFVSRQIPDKYPDWQVAVPDPTQAKTHLTLPPDQLEAVIQLIQRLPNHDTQFQTLGMQWKGNTLNLLAKPSVEVPWLHIPLEAMKGHGPEVTIFLDRRFLIKALQFGLHHISLFDERSPLRLHAQGKQLIIMPVRSDKAGTSPQPTPIRKVETTTAALPKPQPPTTNPMLNRPNPDAPEAGPSAPVMDEALNLCNLLRDRFQDGLNQIRDLANKLKLLQREQKTSAREMSSVRSTLRTLQGLKL